MENSPRQLFLGILAATLMGCGVGTLLGVVFAPFFGIEPGKGALLSLFIGGTVALLLGAIDEFLLPQKADAAVKPPSDAPQILDINPTDGTRRR